MFNVMPVPTVSRNEYQTFHSVSKTQHYAICLLTATELNINKDSENV